MTYDDIRSVIHTYTSSIVDLQRSKGYTTEDAYCFLAGYLGSHLASVIDQLPKAKRHAVLLEMTQMALRKQAEAEVRKEMA